MRPAPAGAASRPEPILIAEVLSPTTAAHDRTRKLDDHRRLPSVREILPVAGQEHTSSTGAARARFGWSGTLIGDADLEPETVPAATPRTAAYQGSGV